MLQRLRAPAEVAGVHVLVGIGRRDTVFRERALALPAQGVEAARRVRERKGGKRRRGLFRRGVFRPPEAGEAEIDVPVNDEKSGRLQSRRGFRRFQGAELRGIDADAARDDDLFRFKQLVARTMSAEATTLLVDAYYGRELLPEIAAPCLPMLAYEADVYRISNDDRITVLPDNLKVSDYSGLGVGVLKFFLYYGPNDPAAINDRKQALVVHI